jgi:hypothetical protein
VRFALERLAQREIIFNEATSIRDMNETSPVKKIKALRRVAPDSAHPHRAVLTNPQTGDQTDFGRYEPLDAGRATKLDGRLGDLLHPKEGLNLGLYNDPWYQAQRKMLLEGIEYLEPIAKASPFALFDDMSNVTVHRDRQPDWNG